MSGGELVDLFAIDLGVEGHDGGAFFVASHDDFEEAFTAAWWERFDAHVVDDEERGFEIAFEASLGATFEVVVFLQFSNEVEDGDVEDVVALFDGGVA